MPIWLTPVLTFFTRRGINFLIYAVLGLLSYGAYQKLFAPTTKNTTNIEKIDKQVNVYKKDEGVDIIPLIGCSAYRVKVEAYYKRRPKDTNEVRHTAD